MPSLLLLPLNNELFITETTLWAKRSKDLWNCGKPEPSSSIAIEECCYRAKIIVIVPRKTTTSTRMPGLRRRFRKFDEDDAEGIAPAGIKESSTKVAQRIKSFRSASFQPLLETPSSIPQDDPFSELKDLTNVTSLDGNEENKAPALEWPEVRNLHEDVSKDHLSPVIPKDSRKAKIPQLKANRLDDIRHNRAKELLSEVGKEKNVDPFVQQADAQLLSAFEATTQQEAEVTAITNDIDGWNPFDGIFSNSLHGDDPHDGQGDSTWGGFGPSPMLPEDFTSPDAVKMLPRAAADGDKEPNEEESSIYSQNKMEMPETLNFHNLLERPRESIEKSVHSDIISLDDNEDGEGKIFLTLNASLKPSTQLRRDNMYDNLFSIGLDTVNESIEDESPKNGPAAPDRKSILYERKELLSPALLPTCTPKGAPIEQTNQCLERREESIQIQLTLEKIVETDELLPESHAADNSICDTTSFVPTGNIETNTAQEDKDFKEKRRNSNVPSDVRIVDRESSFESVRHRVKQKKSIHFNAKPSPTSHNSLLDTESDVSDHVSGLYRAPTSSESTSVDGRMDIIIDAGIFNSDSASTMTYPHTLHKSDSLTTASNHSEYDLRYPRKTKARPLGASAQEIKMLNHFLKIAGPKLRSPNLSTEEREEIHSRAIKAGLPELFVNKILDQTAGIVGWEEQSHGTLLTSESTDESSRHQHSVYSSDSCSTRYRKDNESISYHSYSQRTQTPKEASGMYGCLGNLNTTFWSELERGFSGDDMMENISAALSDSFDDVSWRKPRQRRKRKTQVRV